MIRTPTQILPAQTLSVPTLSATASSSPAACLEGVPFPARDDQWPEFLLRSDASLRRMIYRDLEILSLRRFCEVEEILQEVHVRLWKRRELLSRLETSQAWGYVRRTVENFVRDIRRIRVREVRTLEEFARKTELGCHPLRPPTTSPEERAITKDEIRRFLDDCRAAWRCDRREVRIRAVEMALLEGRSSEEICRRLDGRMSAGQLNTMLYRLRRRFALRGIEVVRRRGEGAARKIANRAPERTCRQKNRRSP